MKLHTTIFVQKLLLTIVLLANLLQCGYSMNSDPNRQIVYEKCRGPGELKFFYY